MFLCEVWVNLILFFSCSKCQNQWEKKLFFNKVLHILIHYLIWNQKGNCLSSLHWLVYVNQLGPTIVIYKKPDTGDERVTPYFRVPPCVSRDQNEALKTAILTPTSTVQRLCSQHEGASAKRNAIRKMYRNWID